MASVNKDFADNLKENNGYYNGDSDNSMGDNPRCVLIVEYDSAFGGKSYGLTFDGEFNRYVPSQYVRNPRVYWKYEA